MRVFGLPPEVVLMIMTAACTSQPDWINLCRGFIGRQGVVPAYIAKIRPLIFTPAWELKGEGVALNTIDPDDFFHERRSTTRAKATQRNCTLGALRWIWLAHALGDIAFLVMGDQNTSLDGLRQMKADKFAALVEFIQTGDDPEDVWRSSKTHAALR
ncbi:hypothetical protein OC835_007782 [Tilletia horrida]|nr:hypothetical protein OC835_007782 [Tilletia horrida]